jgi:N-acetylglucosaminyl-diphospho-decaprenol L-rhamnosyltransferase
MTNHHRRRSHNGSLRSVITALNTLSEMREPSPPRADVVVVAYHSSEVIAGCVESVRSDPAAGHVYVVNNSPGAAVGIHPGQDVTVLEPGVNLGFGRGVNFARSNISSPFVAIVNPDIAMETGTLTKCVAYLHAHSGVAIVSPRVFVSGNLFRTSERDPSFLRYMSYPLGLGARLGVERPLDDHYETHETAAVNGAFLVARAAALDEVGWFDESIFLFGEELDLCRRLRASGHRVVYLSEGRVDHVDGHSTSTAPFDVASLRRAARVEQLRRSRGPARAFLYRWLLRVAAR